MRILCRYLIAQELWYGMEIAKHQPQRLFCNEQVSSMHDILYGFATLNRLHLNRAKTGVNVENQACYCIRNSSVDGVIVPVTFNNAMVVAGM